VIAEAGADGCNGVERWTRVRAAGTEICLESMVRNATKQAAKITIARSVMSNPAPSLRVKGDIRTARSWIFAPVDLGTGGASSFQPPLLLSTTLIPCSSIIEFSGNRAMTAAGRALRTQALRRPGDTTASAVSRSLYEMAVHGHRRPRRDACRVGKQVTLD
jgi:hypothetical protein